MRPGFLLTLALLWAATSVAQTAAPITLATVRTATGQTRWLATNSGTATVTAIAFTYDLPIPTGSKVARVAATTIYDAATEPLAPKPISPGQAVTLPYGTGASGGQVAPQIRAVVFADGTAWGESVWATRIARRRGYLAQYLRAAITELTQATYTSDTPADLASQFQATLSATQADAADGDAALCAASVFGAVVRGLQQVTRSGGGASAQAGDIVQRQIDSLRLRLSSIQAYGANP